MTSSHPPVRSAARPRRQAARPARVAGVVVLLAAVALVGLSQVRLAGPVAGTTPLGDASLLVLALLAFVAGMLSFLSPCCLPILPSPSKHAASVSS